MSTETMALIGMISGIVGVIISFFSYRKINGIKALDLRLEYKKSINSLEIILDELKILSEEANKSRIFRLNAQGLYDSGVMVKWKNFFELKSLEIENLISLYAKMQRLSPSKLDELENEIAEIDKIHKQATSVTVALNKALEDDKIASDRIFQQRNSMNK